MNLIFLLSWFLIAAFIMYLCVLAYGYIATDTVQTKRQDVYRSYRNDVSVVTQDGTTPIVINWADWSSHDSIDCSHSSSHDSGCDSGSSGCDSGGGGGGCD